MLRSGIDGHAASYGGPANFSGRLNQIAEEWTATGELAFMNEWCVMKQLYPINDTQNRIQDVQAWRRRYGSCSMAFIRNAEVAQS